MRFVLLVLLLPSFALALNRNRIEDNSFLVEEAYNQNEGELQLAQSFRYFSGVKECRYVLDFRMPLPDTEHRLSATVPFRAFGGTGGIGDIAVSYRYGLLQQGKILIAPRATLLVPSGEYREGRGTGSIGFQGAVALTLLPYADWAVHWNFFATYVPDARALPSTRLWTFGYGAAMSVVYQPAAWVNLFVEVQGGRNEIATAAGLGYDLTSFVSPGVRLAVNAGSDWQLVPGIAVPLGIGPSAGNGGVFAYLSVEAKAY